MRKIKSAVFAFAAIFFAVSALAVNCAAEGEEQCEHEYETAVVSYASFEKSGEVIEICSRCGLAGSSYEVARVASATLKQSVLSYTGSDIYPSVTVLDEDKNTLVLGRDYVIERDKSVECGEYQMRLRLIGRYSAKSEFSYKIVPQNARELKAEANNASVKLTWKKAPGASEYFIYREQQDGSLKYIASTKKTQYTEKGLKSASSYCMAVRPVYKTSGGTVYSTQESKKQFTTALNMVELSAKSENKSVALSWKRVAGASEYKVYIYKNGEKQLLATTDKLSYTVKGLKSATRYKFAVKAFGKVGKVKRGSVKYAVKTCSTVLSGVSLISCRADSSGIKLSWSEGAGASGYEIYKSAVKGSGYSKIATVSGRKNTQYLNSPVLSDKSRFLKTAASYIGYKESDGSYLRFTDIYNSQNPLPNGTKVAYGRAWCATYVAAMAVKAKVTYAVFPYYTCVGMVKRFMQNGKWIENDRYVPSPGDIIFFDWQDSGYGDNTGTPDHVGIVERVSGSTLYLIEGNIGDRVKRTVRTVGGRYIRGYGKASFKTQPIEIKSGKTYYYKVRAYKTVDGKKIYSAFSQVKKATAR